MRNYVKLWRIKRQIIKLDDLILTEKRYDDIVAYEWMYDFTPTIEFKISRSKVKKLIPFEFITYSHSDIFLNHVFEADISKVKALSRNVANRLMRNFIYQFDKLKLSNKLHFISVYKETLLLVLDLFKKYHQYEKQEEVAKIVKFLIEHLPDETDQVKFEKAEVEKEVLNQRIAFEIEFLNRINTE